MQNLLGRRGPTAPTLTQDTYGAYQAPPPQPAYVPVDNNPTGSLLRHMGPGDTPHITPEMVAAVQQAAASGQNVGAGTFETIGKRQGTYGQDERRRSSRGPRSGLSITPEMLRRAAMNRLG